MAKIACKRTLIIEGVTYRYYDLNDLAKHFNIELSQLPYSIRVLLENLLAHQDKKMSQKMP